MMKLKDIILFSGIGALVLLSAYSVWNFDRIEKQLTLIHRSIDNISFATGVPTPVVNDKQTSQSLDLEASNIDQGSLLGSEDAEITLIVYSDLECPYCREFASEYIPLLKEKYIDKGLLNLLFKNYPLDSHPNAELAAIACLAAGEQGRYWEMFDFLNTHEIIEKTHKDYISFAKEIGVADLSRFSHDIESSEIKYKLWEEIDEAVLVGVQSTPNFILGDLFFSGLLPIETFTREIDFLLELNEKKISVRELNEISNPVLIDVRTPDEYDEGHISNATNIDISKSDFNKKIRSVSRSDNVILYCKAGKRAARAYRLMRNIGYEKIQILDGGYNQYISSSQND